jgi:hypothetical protein
MSDKISPQTSSEPAVAGGAGFGNKSSDGFGKAGKHQCTIGSTFNELNFISQTQPLAK